MTPAERLLAQMEAQLRAAREALADEHEGNFRRAVTILATDADRLHTMVVNW